MIRFPKDVNLRALLHIMLGCVSCVEIEDIDFLVNYYVFFFPYSYHLFPYFYRLYEIDQENHLCWDFLGEKK